MGFTGAFDPNFWSARVMYASLPEQELTADCFNEYPDISRACLTVNNDSAELGADTESTDPPIGTVVTWTWTNTHPFSYIVSFSYTPYISSTSSDPTAAASIAITVGNSNRLLTGNNPPDGFFLNESVEPNKTISFKLSAPIGNDFQVQRTFLTINGFIAVPTPLPATGAACVFAYSRRLRRRSKNAAPALNRSSQPPRRPCSYLADALNLPEDALGRLPVSFEYAALIRPTSHRGAPGPGPEPSRAAAAAPKPVL
jgi:hypothetical protein